MIGKSIIEDVVVVTVGEKIAFKRKELGLSQRLLAKLSGVSQPTISAIESSTKAPSTVTISLIAKALKVQVSDLLDEEKEAVANECDNLNSEKRNIIRIAGRDGSYQEHYLSDGQLDAIKSIIAQLPDASDDL